MQARFSNILRALTTRGLQLQFHTSACTLQGPRYKNKFTKGKGSSRLARYPAHKRLVPTLRPAGKMGTYEVASSGPVNTRNSWHPREGKHQKQGDRQFSRNGTDSFSRSDLTKTCGYAGRAENLQTSNVSPPISDEFDTPEAEALETLPHRFTSPPLMEGFLKSIDDVLGPDARPSPIQSLALKHLFTLLPRIYSIESGEEQFSNSLAAASSLTEVWSQHLLAAETGSGKSIAYLLPMLQHLKLTEHSPIPLCSPVSPVRRLSLNPRGLILAPTHELSRQLAAFAKALLHHVRLRVLCVSRTNAMSSSRGNSTARQLKRELEKTGFGVTSSSQYGNRPVDVLVGTTVKVLEMARGWGWDRAARVEHDWDEARKERARRWVPGKSEIGLAGVEWVVIDEADVLFDREFEASTRLLLADIARARGYAHPSFAALDSSFGTHAPPASAALEYPFHLTLTSATIPTSLANYLSIAHPKMARLASPRLHRIPPALVTEHHAWTSGNKNSDIERRIRRVWVDENKNPTKTPSKVLVFCNKSTKVEDLGLYLKERGIANVALTSSSEMRARGSNRHLAGFLKPAGDKGRKTLLSSPTHTLLPTTSTAGTSSAPQEPHVLITTSLLSRGLDFSPQVRHVFLVDTPRNMVDFLHRAGRTARAGNAGRVVLFGKSKGRGSSDSREVRRQVGAITN